MLIWKKFKFGIFDVDGTLFDNMAVSADVFYEILKTFNLPQNEVRKTYLETNGMNLDDQLKLILNKYGIGYEESAIKILHDDFFEIRDNSPEWKRSFLFPGIEGLLEKLNQEKIINFVSSGSNTDEVIFRLKKTEIFNYFSLVLGAEKTPKGIGHFKEFAKYCGIPLKKFTKSAFLLSDGTNDMALAKKSGIFAIGIANTVSTDELKSAGANIVVLNSGKLASLEF